MNFVFNRVNVPSRAWLLSGVATLFFASATAQNTRLRDNNTIGWFANFTTLRFADRWSGHLEYQFRREDLVTHWQQSLFRTGVNYHVNDQLTVRAGYAWIETFPYGDFPLQAAGRQFPEHRIYQMATLQNPVGRFGISHRFMLEQRWVGQYLDADSPRPDRTVYTNRARYMVRVQAPLFKPKLEDKTAYVAAYDEIFIGFGRNVGENIFDQNRIGLLLGYRFSPAFRLEGGYFQQLVLFGREIQNRSVIQNNQGLIVNTYLDFDFRRK